MLANNKLDDKAIRSQILDNLRQKNYKNKDTIIIEELDLCLGEARIDLAVINGIATGIEIKSDKDTLDRLEHQKMIYNKVFDVVEIVVGKSHQEAVFNIIPHWWGISVVTSETSGQLMYRKIREPQINPSKDPLSVLQLLWKDEALGLLEKKNLASSFKNKTRDKIWSQLLKSFHEEELFKSVNQCLKNRHNWRFVHQLK